MNGSLKEKLNFIKKADYRTLTTGRDEDGQPFLQAVFEVYRKLIGEACSHCPSKINGYISILKNLNPNKMESQYKLKGSNTIRDGYKTYSNHNLTDEVAEKLLKQNPKRAKLFSKMPKGWDKETPKTDEEMTLSELREKYPEIKARSKSDFLQEVAEANED